MKLINAIQDDQHLIYLKPDNCLVRNNEDFYMPEFSSHITARLTLVIKIKKIGKKVAERFAPRYYDEISVGLNLEANDKLSELRQAGLPWDEAIAFDYSAPIGKFRNKSENGTISLQLNDNIIKSINISAFNVNQIITKASHIYTLKIGDLIYISLSEVDAKLAIGQQYVVSLDEEELLRCAIK